MQDLSCILVAFTTAIACAAIYLFGLFYLQDKCHWQRPFAIIWPITTLILALFLAIAFLFAFATNKSRVYRERYVSEESN